MTSSVAFFLNGTELGGDQAVFQNHGGVDMYCQGAPV